MVPSHLARACVAATCGTPPRHTLSRQLTRGSKLARSPMAKEGLGVAFWSAQVLKQCEEGWKPPVPPVSAMDGLNPRNSPAKLDVRSPM